MLKDNYAEYDRNKTRGVPRPGKALLHGLVYCRECGHKMVVQYKSGTHYLCNYLRQQYGLAGELGVKTRQTPLQKLQRVAA
jgi:hypothetical protein